MSLGRDVLNITLDFSPGHRVSVGRIALDQRVGILEYDSAFLDNGLTLNPLLGTSRLQHVERARNPRAFGGLHGFIADSLPDGWGEIVLRRRATALGYSYADLSDIDRLAIVGDRGHGALSYAPAADWSDYQEGSYLDVRALAIEATAVLDGAESEVIARLERLGGSSGGARPKLLIGLDGQGRAVAGDGDLPPGAEAWIVKFRASADDAEAGPLEAAYADMAREAGLTVSDTRLLSGDTNVRYFATKRFDRSSGNGRLHMLSAAGALDLDAYSQLITYERLFDLTRTVTASEYEVANMVRRMMFNVVAHNYDDHAKQHAYLMDAKGTWSLAPAFDLTYSAGPGGEHSLMVGREAKNVSREELLRVAAAQITRPAAEDMLEHVTAAVANFRTFAARYEISTRATEEVASVLDEGLRARYIPTVYQISGPDTAPRTPSPSL